MGVSHLFLFKARPSDVIINVEKCQEKDIKSYLVDFSHYRSSWR